MKNQKLLILFALLFIAVSCSNFPKFNSSNLTPAENEFEDLIFVIDISSSMLSKDFDPNRLEAVKARVNNLIEQKSKNQKIAVVLFAWDAIIICPLTKRQKLLKEKVKNIKVGKLNDGTAIGKGLLYGIYELSQSKNKKQAIILFTDGVNNIAEIPIEFPTRLTKNRGIQIHSYGVGCNGKALSPDSHLGNGVYNYSQIPVRIDEALLKGIGQQTKGSYQRITCNKDLEEIEELDEKISHIGSIDKFLVQDSLNQFLIDSLWNVIPKNNTKFLDQYLSNE